jgi:hypothetical protein
VNKFISNFKEGLFLLTKKARTLFAVFPIAWVFLFLLLVLRAYIRVGQIPTYDNPDPNVFPIHHYILLWGMVLCLLITTMYPILTLVKSRSEPFNYKQAGIFLLGISLFYMLIYFDSFNLKDWFMD